MERVRWVLAAVVVLAGCDALWGIDRIDPAIADGPVPDAPAIFMDARPHTGPFMHFTMDQVEALGYTTDSIGNYQATCAPTCPDMVGGHVGGALEFDSTGQLDQRLEISAITEFQIVDQFSVAGWVRLTALAVEACAWSKPYSTGGTDTWQLCFNPSGAVSFITYAAGGSNQTSTVPGWATLGTFHHVAIVYDGVMKTLYWDGEIAVQGEGALPLVDGNDVLIANDLDGAMYVAPFDGALDELNFFTYALTPAEVAVLAAQ